MTYIKRYLIQDIGNGLEGLAHIKNILTIHYTKCNLFNMFNNKKY